MQSVTSHESSITSHGSRVTSHAVRDVQLAPPRIAIFRALQLGDLLCTVPAWRALRAAYPHASITLIALPWAREFAARFAHYVDDFIEFPGVPGLPERDPDAAAWPRFLKVVRERRFDLALQMHGSGERTNPLVREWKPRRLVGFHASPHAACSDAELLLPWHPHESEVRRFLRLAAAAGAPAQGEQLEFPLYEDERVAAVQLRSGRSAPYVCIHPGARYPSRRWPAERFAAVADALAERGLEIVVTGSAEERDLARAVVERMRFPAYELTGRTTLGSFAALASGARLVVCNDTGMSHVAAAVHAASVVISSGADAQRWRPLDARRHRMLWHATPCRPCAHRVCPTQHECADGVTVDDVLDAAARLLDGACARAA